MDDRNLWYERLATGLALAAVLLGGCRTAPVPTPSATGSREHTFRLQEITAEQGRVFLDAVGLDGSSAGPEPNTLLVNGSPEELERAGVILGLVDANSPYVIQELAPARAVRTLPSNDQIAELIGQVVIGTFAAPPAPGPDARAIIDVCGESVVAVVPPRLWPDVRAVVESGGRAVRQRREDSGTDEPDRAPVAVMPDGQSRASGPLPIEPAPVEPPQQPSGRDAAAMGSDAPGRPEPNAVADDVNPSPPESRPAGRIVPVHRPGQDPNAAVPTIEKSAVGRADGDSKTPSAVGGRLQVPLDNGDDILEVSLPERIGLIQLIDLVGEYLRLDCVYDAEKIGYQVVTLKLHSKLQSEIRVKDLYSLLETILKFKGLVMTRQAGNLVTIVPAAEALDVDPELVDPNTKSVQAGNVVVTRVFQLRHVDVSSVANLLQNMKLGLAVSPIEASQTLFVTCYAHRMGRIAQLVDMVDQPGRPKEFRFRQLRYTVATALTEKILGLAEELRDIPITIAASSPDAPQAPSRLPRRAKPPAEPGAAAVPAASGVYLDVDGRTNRILMIGAPEQLEVVEELIDALDIPEQDVRTLSVYYIRHIDAADVMSKLEDLGLINKPAAVRPGPARTGQTAEPPAVYEAPDEQLQVVLLEATNALLVNATPEQHNRIQAILDYVDMSPQDLRTLQVYEIEHVEASEVMDTLEQLGVVRTAGSTTGRLTTAPPGAAAAARTPPAEDETPQGVLLAGINSLLVRATDSQHAGIQSVIRHIDVEARQETIPYEVYFLENQDPEQLAELLGKLVQDTVRDKEGKVEKVVPKTEEQIVIVPDKTTFALIVYASRKNQEWIAKLVAQLDKRRPQVLIDCTLVEVTKNEAFSYDLNVLRSWPDLSGTSPVTGTEPNVLGRFVQWGSGSLTAFYGDSEIQALLKAMQSKNYGRVLAKPKLLVNDNEQGKIETKDTTYVEVTSSIPVTSGAAGNQTNLVQTSVNYNPYEAGITLDITPHISEGDLLRLDIVLTRSDFLKSLPTKPPNTRSNKVDTAVTLPNGSTVILGGLMKMNQNKGGSKVPILGDLPWVGGLFRSVSNEDTQSKLYVFVKAEVIRPAGITSGMEELEAISAKNRQAFEQHELEFQKYQNVPGVKPAPVDPAKVLDTR